METRLKKRMLSCSICYQKIGRQGQIDSCDHPFCFDCIKNWAAVLHLLRQIENTCPMCKRRFVRISEKINRVNYRNSRNQRLEEIHLEQKNQTQPENQIMLSIEELTEGLLLIMEMDQELWNSILTSEVMAMTSDWNREHPASP